MNSSFNYKLINFFIEKKKKNEGFTLPELIVSGFISLLVLLAGFTFLRMNLNINKSDETNVKLAANMNNALDFIVDEIADVVPVHVLCNFGYIFNHMK